MKLLLLISELGDGFYQLLVGVLGLVRICKFSDLIIIMLGNTDFNWNSSSGLFVKIIVDDD